MAKILIITDDHDMAGAISGMLMPAGYFAIVAESSDQALEILETEAGIGLIMLDHHISPKSGIALLGRMPRFDRFRRVPVIICSGDAKPDAATHFISLYIVGFLVKPFSSAQFIRDVERALKQHRRMASKTKTGQALRLEAVI